MRHEHFPEYPPFRLATPERIIEEHIEASKIIYRDWSSKLGSSQQSIVTEEKYLDIQRKLVTSSVDDGYRQLWTGEHDQWQQQYMEWEEFKPRAVIFVESINTAGVEEWLSDTTNPYRKFIGMVVDEEKELERKEVEAKYAALKKEECSLIENNPGLYDAWYDLSEGYQILRVIDHYFDTESKKELVEKWEKWKAENGIKLTVEK